MEIDINFGFCYHTTNANITAMFWKTYGHGLWYDTRKETYAEALERIKEIIWNEIYAEFPHLKGTEIVYTESELPIQDQETIKEKALTTEERIMDLINNAESVAEMKNYKASVANNSKQYPSLQKAFDKKLKSLK